MNSDNKLFPAVYAADLAKTIALEQSKLEFMPDWWQQVVAELHSQLDKQFPPFEVEFEELAAADVIPPWKGRPDRHCPVCSEPEDKPHAPDCEYAVLDSLHLPGMENSRLNAMDWRFNGIEERLGTIESLASAYRLNALEERLAALEDWADIEYAPVDDNPPDSIHALIAEGMTSVTTHCMESAAGLVTEVATIFHGRADALQELVMSLQARIDALESKTPC